MEIKLYFEQEVRDAFENPNYEEGSKSLAYYCDMSLAGAKKVYENYRMLERLKDYNMTDKELGYIQALQEQMLRTYSVMAEMGMSSYPNFRR